MGSQHQGEQGCASTASVHEGRKTPNFHQFKTGHGTLPKPAKQTYAFNIQRDGGLNKIPLVTYSIFFSPSQCHGYSQRNLDFSKSRGLQRSLKPHQSLKKHTVTASQIV